jgi:hypothetical protein
MSTAASSNPSSPFTTFPSVKLTKNNFVIWQAIVLPAIRGARLEAFLDIDQEEPAKEIIVKEGDTSNKQENPDYGV